MWIREYVFNSLIPVIHMLIYTIFVTSATELVEENPLYAIVCIGFIIPAEKFIRKMFGFDKASTVSQLGAAAGGAMVMNAINKFGANGANAKSGGGNSDGSSSGKGNGVRTPSTDPLANFQQAAPQQPGQPGQPGQPLSPLQQPPQQLPPQKRGVASNVGNWVKDHTIAPEARRKNLARIAGAVGRIGGGTIGLAAGIASGDFSKAATYSAAGFIAGGKGAKGLVNRGFSAADSARYTGQAIFKGEEYANNQKFNREFMRSKEYRNIMRNHPETTREDVKAMLDAGITDSERMDTILTNMKKYNTDLEHSIAFSQLAEGCSDSVLYDQNKLRKYLDSKNIQYNPNDITGMQDSILAYK